MKEFRLFLKGQAWTYFILYSTAYSGLGRITACVKSIIDANGVWTLLRQQKRI